MLFLVAGGAGYLGSVLVPQLLSVGHRVTVLDRFYFEDGAAQAGTQDALQLVRADIRDIQLSDLETPDVLIDISGISNDPACELDTALTVAINRDASARLAEQAFRAGVGRMVFASSCSVYGHGTSAALDEDAPLNPVSLYARCKAEAEQRLLEIAECHGGSVTLLRFATLFGVSPRMRFDLAVNVMTKNAYVNGTIVVEGGGNQWRPFLHVADAARAVRLVAQAPPERVKNRVFNVGGTHNNVRIKHLAYRVRDSVPGTEIVMAPTDPDLRDYNVNFDRIHRELDYRPKLSIEDGIREVVAALSSGDLDPEERRWYRLQQYRFMAEVDRAYAHLALNGTVLGVEPAMSTKSP